jgi:hypothetical protein
MNVPSISGPTFLRQNSRTKDYSLDERPAGFGQGASKAVLFPHLYSLRRSSLSPVPSECQICDTFSTFSYPRNSILRSIQRPDMTRKQFTFIRGLPLRSKREQELEQAKARSHAARVVHKRAKDADQGYQQLMRYLLGPHGGDYVPPQANEGLAISSDNIFEDHVADNYETQPGATDQQLGRREIVVLPKPTQSALGLIPPYFSLRQGNSDPFNAFAVPINSRTNALMTYTREFYLPTREGDATNPEAAIRPEDWKECVGLLSDTGTAYAHLARVAAFMAQPGKAKPEGNVEFGRQALIFNGKGTLVLRERIRQGALDYLTLYVMSCFHAAEIYSQNYTAARLHASMLARLFESDDIPVDDNLLYGVMRHEAVLSMLSLTRTPFDVDKWLPEVIYRRFKSLTLPESISLEAMEEGLEKQIIDNVRLKDAIVLLRQILSLLLLAFRDPAYDKFEYKYFTRYICQMVRCRLVKLYLDAEPLCVDRANLGPIITGRALVQAYVSVATIQWLYWITTGGKTSMRVSMYTGYEMQTSRLKEKLTESEWMVSDDVQRQYNGIRLWTLYVGAFGEQAEISSSGFHDSAAKQWFNVRLARHANAMGLKSWQQVRERLHGVLFTDVMKPHGSVWFAKTMEANLF